MNIEECSLLHGKCDHIILAFRELQSEMAKLDFSYDQLDHFAKFKREVDDSLYNARLARNQIDMIGKAMRNRLISD
jgi:hypothetical protein